jgi:hypothetical protein
MLTFVKDFLYDVLCHSDNNIPLFMPRFDIPVRLGNLLQRIALIDNGFDLARLYQLFDGNSILSAFAGCRLNGKVGSIFFQGTFAL